MRVGIDSYSYHRLLGEIRPGERDPGTRLSGAGQLIAEMLDAGAEVLSLETVFLDAPGRVDAGALREALDGREPAIAWGHPLGLEWGTRPEMLADLLAWIELAPALGARIVRCVAAGPALAAAPRPRRTRQTAEALRTAEAHARRNGVALALE
ncbi:MAG TPA: hypothetical protein VHB30_00295, partial [Solirubrobacteraceae bacterium]|nr:hypothetical protein [Solirubrobacteraceae bacterium]